MQQNLFPGIVPPRPTRQTIDMSGVIEKLTSQIMTWGNNERYIEDVRENITELLGRSQYPDNGYELAKRLENDCYYSPDAELVEILDGVHHLIEEAVRQAVRQWVLEYNIAPALSIGTQVKVLFSKTEYDGEITNTTDKAEYIVTIPALNHKHGYGAIKTYEDLEAYQIHVNL